MLKTNAEKYNKDTYKIIRFKDAYSIDDLNNGAEKEKDKLKVYEIAHILFNCTCEKENINKIQKLNTTIDLSNIILVSSKSDNKIEVARILSTAIRVTKPLEDVVKAILNIQKLKESEMSNILRLENGKIV